MKERIKNVGESIIGLILLVVFIVVSLFLTAVFFFGAT
jgi:hypothetical protein